MPTWEEFKQKHVLNPNIYQGYETWDRNDQNTWLRNRLAAFEERPRQGYGSKKLNSVIIATSQEILDDFRNPGQRYGPQQDFYWSNRKYPVWQFRKRNEPDSSGQQYSVTKLNERHGPMHFLARTAPPHEGYKPIHLHRTDITPSDNLRNY